MARELEQIIASSHWSSPTRVAPDAKMCAYLTRHRGFRIVAKRCDVTAVKIVGRESERMSVRGPLSQERWLGAPRAPARLETMTDDTLQGGSVAGFKGVPRNFIAHGEWNVHG